MGDLTDLTVHELQEKLANKEITIKQINEAYINRINERGNNYGKISKRIS